jgi:DMSO/TMAO reductase YedYZ molybdopterin-dependent catalytic subunit
LLFPPPAPAPRAPGFPVAGQPPEVTLREAFYVVSKNVEDPAPSALDWRLTVHGEVAEPLELDLARLRALPRIDLYATLQCVSNPVGGPLMGNGLWSGVRMADLLAAAGPRPGAGWFVCRGLDGHFEDLPLAVAVAPDTLVAYALNGELLDRRHGFPARLIVPGRYGFKNVKWLTAIEVVGREVSGHWPSRGWTREAPMQTSARVDLVRRAGDGLVAAGVALAGARSVAQVEARVVSQQGVPGGWIAADLHAPPLGLASWVQWRARLPLPTAPGARVEARAVDGLGRPQSLDARSSFPDGATGLHGLEVDA